MIKPTLRIFAYFALIAYLPMLAISYWVEPETPRIDIFQMQNRGDHASLGLYGYRLQTEDMPKIVLLGASGVMHGMRPEEFETEFPGHQVVNFAVSGTNISGIHQVMAAARATLSDADRKRTRFVIGVFFGTFIENRVRYGRFRPDGRDVPDCAEQIASYGFYQLENDEVIPRFSPTTWKILSQLQRPFLAFADKLFFDSLLFESVRAKLANFRGSLLAKTEGNDSLGEPPADPDFMTPNRISAVNFWPTFMDRPKGDLSNEQFDRLLILAEYAREHGLDVTLVDLPIAEWHSKHSPLFRDYQERKKQYFNAIRESGNLQIIDMQDLGSSRYFSDSVHVRSEYSKIWPKTIHARWNTKQEQ